MLPLPFFKPKPAAVQGMASPLRPMRRGALPETPYDETDAVARLRKAAGLPVEPPDPARSSLVEAPAPAPTPRPAPVAQKPAATKACPGHGSRANGTYYLHTSPSQCWGA